jgi:hypothetical protein
MKRCVRPSGPICTYLYVYICMHTYAHIHTHIVPCVYMHTYIHTYPYTYTSRLTACPPRRYVSHAHRHRGNANASASSHQRNTNSTALSSLWKSSPQSLTHLQADSAAICSRVLSHRSGGGTSDVLCRKWRGFSARMMHSAPDFCGMSICRLWM